MLYCEIIMKMIFWCHIHCCFTQAEHSRFSRLRIYSNVILIPVALSNQQKVAWRHRSESSISPTSTFCWSNPDFNSPAQKRKHTFSSTFDSTTLQKSCRKEFKGTSIWTLHTLVKAAKISAGKSSHRHLRTWVTVIIQHSLYHTCTDRRRTVACAVQRRKESQRGGERRIWGLLTCCLHILHGCWRQDGSRSALRNRLERERAEEDRWGVQGGWQVSGKAGWREGRCEERGRWMNRGGKRVTGGCCIPSLRTEPHKASRAECCTHPAPAPLSLWVQLPDCCHKKDAASVSGIRQGNLCVCVCVLPYSHTKWNVNRTER